MDGYFDWLPHDWTFTLQPCWVGGKRRFEVILTHGRARDGFTADTTGEAIDAARNWAETYGAVGGVPRDEPDAGINLYPNAGDF